MTVIAGGFGLLAVHELRGGEFDVVGLPHGRGLAGVDEGLGDLVDGPAVVVLAVEAVAVEDLDFVAALEVDAGVAAALAGVLRLVGDAEFDVELELAVELLLGHDVAGAVDLHGPVVEDLPLGGGLAVGVGPVVETLAVEQDDGPFRGGGGLGVVLVLGILELEVGDVAVLGGGGGGREEGRGQGEGTHGKTPGAKGYTYGMHVMLFDIDGTLIRSGGAGKGALEGALAAAFGVAEVRDGVPYAGRTDAAIGTDLLVLHGIEPSAANLDRLHRAYLNELPTALERVRGLVLPGVVELLDSLGTRPAVALGLLTGNVRRGAELKLRHHGLWERFAFGGFGDGATNRDDVARAAVADAVRHLGREPARERVWVIGDTPHDVTCARAVGAKVVGVATGWHTAEELLGAGADVVLRDLTEAGSWLRACGLA